MTGTAVTLAWGQVLVAAQVGCYRHVMALSKRHSEPNGHLAGDAWGADVEAAAAEFAAAIALGACWPMATPSDPRTKPPDLDPDVEVRWTPREDGCLIVRRRDDPQRRFVLVTGRIPTFTVVGWIAGHDAKRGEWYRDDPGRAPSWFVPQDALEELHGLEVAA